MVSNEQHEPDKLGDGRVEDVQFSFAQADEDDLEAQRRAEAADKRAKQSE